MSKHLLEFSMRTVFCLLLLSAGTFYGKWIGKSDADRWWQKSIPNIYWFGTVDGSTYDWSYLFKCPNSAGGCQIIPYQSYVWTPPTRENNKVYGPPKDIIVDHTKIFHVTSDTFIHDDNPDQCVDITHRLDPIPCNQGSDEEPNPKWIGCGHPFSDYLYHPEQYECRVTNGWMHIRPKEGYKP